MEHYGMIKFMFWLTKDQVYHFALDALVHIVSRHICNVLLSGLETLKKIFV